MEPPARRGHPSAPRWRKIGLCLSATAAALVTACAAAPDPAAPPSVPRAPSSVVTAPGTTPSESPRLLGPFVLSLNCYRLRPDDPRALDVEVGVGSATVHESLAVVRQDAGVVHLRATGYETDGPHTAELRGRLHSVRLAEPLGRRSVLVVGQQNETAPLPKCRG